MVAQPYEYTNCLWIIYFNMVDFMLYELLPNKNEIDSL